MSTTIHIAYMGSSKKWPLLTPLLLQPNVTLKRIGKETIERDMDDENIKVDFIFHKLSSSQYLDFSKDKGNIARKLYNFAKKKNAVTIDNILAIERLYNRIKLFKTLQDFYFCHGKNIVSSPTTYFVHNGNISNIRPTFPVIVKPSDGASHNLFFAYNQEGIKEAIKEIGKDGIIQEYIYHAGVIHKVYILGDKVITFDRASFEDDLIRGKLNNSKLNWEPVARLSNPNSFKQSHQKENKRMTSFPLSEFVKKVKSVLELEIFGIDLIEDVYHPGYFYLIDVNYFPGFYGIEEKVHYHLYKLAKEWKK